MADNQLSIEFDINFLQKIVDSGCEFILEGEQKRDIFKNSCEQYVQRLVERYGELKILGMHKPIPLLSLFVRANILEKISARAEARVEELEKFFDFDRRTFGKKVETKDGEEIANNLQRFIVLGKPGAGKTTFLKHLTLAMVYKQSIIKHRRLPIFVTLRDWADKRINNQFGLMQYIEEQFKICNFEQPGPFVDTMLKQGNCLVLFDGLDEVGQETNLDGVVSEIRDFTSKYSKNQFVISCRTAAYNHWFEHFTDVEMADFNEEQIETFVRNWFANGTKTAEKFLNYLKVSPQLRELSSVPLLLTLLCISYGANKDFPTSRADLYEEAISALLKNWDSSRRIRREGPDPYNQLSLIQKKNMFSRIAFGTFTENRYFIHERELTKIIENFVSKLPIFKEENLEVDSIDVLRSIEAHHGIFVERAKCIFSFAHLTFQEYFTAKYISDNDSSQNTILDNLVQKHLYDDKWKEVFLLVTGMLPDADELLLRMLKKNQELLQEPVLNDLIFSATKMLLPSDNKYSVVAKKSMAFYIILERACDNCRSRGYNRNSELARNVARAFSRELARERTRNRALDRAHNLARDLARDITRDFDHDFDRALDRILDRSLARALALARSRDLTRDINLNLDLDLSGVSTSSTEDVEKISDYLKGTHLIFQCLKTSSYLSKSTREYILNRILTPLNKQE